MSDILTETNERLLREMLTAAALTGLLSGVDIIMLTTERRKLPGKDIAAAAVILANHTIEALNTDQRMASEPIGFETPEVLKMRLAATQPKPVPPATAVPAVTPLSTTGDASDPPKFKPKGAPIA